ncbi:hypothetical protein OV079_29185 [Nannocystis pusilla]|uniref:Uncharacterized protein n=1 Tax=Nannocystis pusilla TaxID=889268 RepID=A0A9X3J101_9BACT|nr:hypothetical protein [Nannocystis pusilla]MCY1009568.1 hypothetical protein [Nannocystis pusilla]
MRPIGLLLCVSACTLDNPAFTVSDTEVGSASSAASADPTRPTTTTSASTTTSTDPDPTGSTTSPATTANVSDSDVTTDPPATSSSTTDATTTTTDPQPMTTVTSDTGDPVACGSIDVTGPQLPLLLAEDNASPPAAECMAWQGKDYSGRLEATPAGFKLVETEDCPSSEVPGQGFVFPLSLGLEPPAHNFECVKLRFAIHQGTEDCLVTGLTVAHAGVPVITASFGQTLYDPNMPYQVGFKPTGMCGSCPDCCAPEPDPDVYTFELDNKPIAQGEQLQFLVEGKKHLFRNLRSHIHSPECQQLGPPEWLHFDWVVLRLD